MSCSQFDHMDTDAMNRFEQQTKIINLQADTILKQSQHRIVGWQAWLAIVAACSALAAALGHCW